MFTLEEIQDVCNEARAQHDVAKSHYERKPSEEAQLYYYRLKEKYSQALYALGVSYEANERYPEAVDCYWQSYELTGLHQTKLRLKLDDQHPDEGDDSVSLDVDEGDADQLFLAGLQYGAGIGVKQSWVRSFDMMNHAAQLGSAKGQFCLGRMYDLGQGVTTDYKEAVRWYSAATEQGYARAHTYLGF